MYHGHLSKCDILTVFIVVSYNFEWKLTSICVFIKSFISCLYSQLVIFFNAEHLAKTPFAPYGVGKIFYLFDTTLEAHVA